MRRLIIVVSIACFLALTTLSAVAGPVYQRSIQHPVATPAPTQSTQPPAANQMSVQRPLDIPAPTQLKSAADVASCSEHMPTFGCNLGLADGDLILVWSCSGCDVDGYRAYRDDRGGALNKTTFRKATHTLVASQTNGATMTGVVLPKADYSGACYTVTAYKGNNESPPSARLCIGATPQTGGATKVLQPMQTGSGGVSFHNATGWVPNNVVFADNGGGSDAPILGGNVSVGVLHATNKSAGGDHKYTAINRGYAVFVLDEVAGKHITKATLHLHRTQTLMYIGGQYGQSQDGVSCATRVGAAAADFYNAKNRWVDGEFSASIPTSSGADTDVDVLQIVRGWANGAPNHGFVIRGNDENLGAFTESECISGFEGITLTVQYVQ